MKSLKVCFVGVGSIAKRHIRNLNDILSEKGVDCLIDVFRSGKGALLPKDIEMIVNRCITSTEEITEKYDVVFVTNPTSKHFSTIIEFQNFTDAFFIEKPVFHTSDINLNYLEISDKCCYVACPLRYTGVIRHLKETLKVEDIRSVRVVSSSYLPAWRPDTDYRKTYSARKELGGGVSIDLVHEWDYITYLLGMPDNVVAIIKKISNLEIDSDDIAIYMAEYKNCLVEVHLDYFTKESIRRIEITTEEGMFVADLINQTIRYPDNDMVSFDSERNSYQKRELQYFLDVLEGKAKNTNDINNALNVLAITEGKVKKARQSIYE